MVRQLPDNLARYCGQHQLHVDVTLNVDEEIMFKAGDYPFRVTIHTNAQPKGFAANHNAAFLRNTCKYFCVLNPDVRLTSDPFSVLLDGLQGETGLIAPDTPLLVAAISPVNLKFCYSGLKISQYLIQN